MSVFLALIEFGPRAAPPRSRPPLRLCPILVRPRGSGSAARPGSLVTDGIASERLQAVGKGSVAYLGEALRAACQQLVRERLELGVQVALVFFAAEGTLQEIVCDVRDATSFEIDELPAHLPAMRLGVPAWVTSRKSLTAQLQERDQAIRRVLEQAAPVLSEGERSEVRMFLDAGEYGVALETLCDLLREQGKRLPSDVAEQVRAIGVDMGMGATTFDDIGVVDGGFRG